MNCMVDSLDIENKILITSNGVKYKYNILISTIPLKTLINMCGIISKTKMTCNKVLVFNIGFDKKPRYTMYIGCMYQIKILIFIESDFMIILLQVIKEVCMLKLRLLKIKPLILKLNLTLLLRD